MVGEVKINVKLADRGACFDCSHKRRSTFPLDRKFKDNFFAHIGKHLDQMDSPTDSDLQAFIKPQAIALGSGEVLIRLNFETERSKK